MRGLLALIVGLALLSLVLWFTRGEPEARSGAERAAVSTNPEASLSESASPPSISGEERRGAPARAAREVADDSQSAGERTPASTSPTLEVVLVDPYGAAVPNAVVFVLEAPTTEVVIWFRVVDWTDDLMEKYGKLRFANERGRIDISRPLATPTLLLARSGNLWGQLCVEPTNDERVELLLEADDTLRVRLLASDGRPLVGENIQLIRYEPGPHVRESATTAAPDGIAVFRHIQRLVDAAAPWSISVDAVLEQRIDVPLDPEQLPRDVVTLSLPPVGSLELTVLAEDGRTPVDNALVEVGIVEDGVPRELSASERMRRATPARRPSGGHVRYSLVQSGCLLEISAQREHSATETRRIEPGPAVAGEVLALELRLGSGHPLIAIRAVDASREPLASARLEGLYDIALGGTSQRSAIESRTDENGDALLDLGTSWLEGMRRSLLLTCRGGQGLELRARIELSYELSPGVNDLGEVIFEEGPPAMPLVVAGRVVDEAGVGIGRARLSLYARDAQTDTWERVPPFLLRADAEGHFELEGEPPPGALRLCAAQTGYVGVAQPFTAGDTNIVIALPRGGAIAGDLLLDPETDENDVRVEISADSLAPELHDLVRLRADVEQGGEFLFEGLPTGSYEVVIVPRTRGSEYLRVPAVRVTLGRTTHDPRLAGIDLRGAVHRHELNLAWPRRTGRSPAACRYRLAGTTTWTSRASAGNDRIELVTSFERIDVEVFSSGYRSLRFDDVAGKIDIEFEREGLSVRLYLNSEAGLPAAPYRLKAQLVPRGAGSLRIGDPFGPAFDERGELLIQAPGPGEMELVWCVESRVGSISTAGDYDLPRKTYFEVLDLPTEQSFEVTLSAAELAEILSSVD